MKRMIQAMHDSSNEHMINLMIECDNITQATKNINKWFDVYGKQGFNWKNSKDMAQFLNSLELAIFFAKEHMKDLKAECNKTKWVEY